VKGERPRTHSSKKKIMKTYTNSDSELQNRTAQRTVEAKLHAGLISGSDFTIAVLPTATECWTCSITTRPAFLGIVPGCRKVGLDCSLGRSSRRYVTAELAQLGFHWNRRRQVWQHPCGQFRTGIVKTRARSIRPFIRRINQPGEPTMKRNRRRLPITAIRVRFCRADLQPVPANDLGR
jgi:hypothetical protein